MPNEEEHIKVIKALPSEVRGVMSHHFRNSLAGAMSMAQQGYSEKALEAMKHMVKDLEMFGI